MTNDGRHGRRSDEALIAASSSDPEAFGEFYDRYERAVFVFMARRTRNAETAADLTAETFAAALAGRTGFKAAGGAPAVAWLFGIARNTLAASHRRHAVATDARRRLQMQRIALPEQTVDALQHLIDHEHGLEALAQLDALPETHASAIRAHIIDDREYADIALELEASGVTVRQHVSRGLAALRRLVSQP